MVHTPSLFRDRDKSDVPSAWSLSVGEGPLIAVALHAGHAIRGDALEGLGVAEDVRLREEDPLSDRLASIFSNHVVVHRSRFEVDLNRPRRRAVYRTPADAWNLPVDRRGARTATRRSLRTYDRFYHLMRPVLHELVRDHGRCVVLDLHTYNHRRAGANAPPAPPEKNPEINLGTAWMDDARWGHLTRELKEALQQHRLGGAVPDVRENVRFGGGHFSRWVDAELDGRGCAIAVEVKKTFMDEWTGAVQWQRLRDLRASLGHAGDALVRALESSR